METAFLDPHLWIIYIFIIYSPLLKVYIQGILFCQKISIWRIPKYASVLAQLFLKKEIKLAKETSRMKICSMRLVM